MPVSIVAAQPDLAAPRTGRRVSRPVGRNAALPLLLLTGFAAAVALRCAVGGDEVARSQPAGLVFAAALLLLVGVARPTAFRSALTWRRPLIGGLAGLAGGIALCIPALASALDGGSFGHSRPGFVPWALVVTVVASAEEAFLRGTLYRLLASYGTLVAIGVPAVAFAALHVPLYGWGAAPLDLAVGVWLGALRVATGTVVAPAVAHVVADWAGWVLLVP